MGFGHDRPPRHPSPAYRHAGREAGTSPVKRSDYTAADLAAEEFDRARPHLLKAMKHVDHAPDRDMHRRIGELTLELDDIQVILGERGVR